MDAHRIIPAVSAAFALFAADGAAAAGLACAAPTGEALSAPPHVLLRNALRRGVQPQGEAVLRDARIYVLYFGAAWCGPCRLQVRALKALHDQGDDARLGYQVIFASQDSSPAAAADYVAAEAMPWPYLPPGAAGPAREVATLGGRSVPDMVVVDDRGRVLCRAYGPDGRYRGVSQLLQALRRDLAP